MSAPTARQTPRRSPRYTGVRTFARCPHVTDPDGVDVAVVGRSVRHRHDRRPGARFGPEAIRAGSMLSAALPPRPRRRRLRDPVGRGLGRPRRHAGQRRAHDGQIADGLAPLLGAGVVPIVLGGDHSVALGELRAQAAVHGPVAVVLLDAHADTWDQYYGERYFHGTPFRRAVEEGLLAPGAFAAGRACGDRCTQRLTSPGTRELGFELISGEELRRDDAGGLRRAASASASATRPAYLSFDIDFVDPAFAPGTGTPEVGGLDAARGARLVASLAGIEFTGFDVVEVSPPYDGPGQTTALLAANVAYEFLALTALAQVEPPARLASAALLAEAASTTTATSAPWRRRGCAGTSFAARPICAFR